MIDREMFRKESLRREELAAFYQSECKKTQFPWLDEMRSILREKYEARVMTALYDFSFDTHRITFCVYAYEDMKKLPMDINSLKKPNIHDAQIKALIMENLCPKRWEKLAFSVEIFLSWASIYLWGRIEAVSERLAKEFAYLKLYRVCVPVRGVTAFIFNEKEQARAFVLDTELRDKVKKRIFELVKPYDDYGVLKSPDEIEIMADYRGHFGIENYRFLEEVDIEKYMKALYLI